MATQQTAAPEFEPLEKLLHFRDRQLIEEGRFEEAFDRVRTRYRWANRLVVTAGSIVIAMVLVQFFMGSRGTVQFAMLVLAVFVMIGTLRRKREVEVAIEKTKTLLAAKD